jgi:hypothetical protein
LQFTAVHLSSSGYTSTVRPAARTPMNPGELAPLKLLIRWFRVRAPGAPPGKYALIEGRPTPLQMRLTQSEDGHQGLIDTPLLLRAHPAHKFTKPPCADGADLLNQDTAGLTKQLDLGPERCRPRRRDLRSVVRLGGPLHRRRVLLHRPLRPPPAGLRRQPGVTRAVTRPAADGPGAAAAFLGPAVSAAGPTPNTSS